MPLKNLLELAAFLALLVLARRGALRGTIDALGTRFDALVRRPVLAGAVLFVVATGGTAIVACLTGLPGPAVHDEFSYLLAADTFLEGRLANPTHPMWRHFETFHVLQQPSYASKYPPAMGLLLAGGSLLGHPLVGVWISTGLAVVATYWMLLGWVSRRWAFVAAIVPALHHYVVLAWAQSYWGGTLPMLGGALVLGAVPRLRRGPSVGSAVMLAAGAGLLANTRPFEGFVLCLPVAGYLLWRTATAGRDLGRYALRFVLPATLVLGGVVSGMLRYNAAVTGHATRMPYTVHHETYEVCPVFLWQPLQPEPEYRNPAMRDFYTGWSLSWYDYQRTLAGVVSLKGMLYADAWWSLVGGLLAVPVVIGAFAARGWTRWFPLGVAVAVCVANLAVPWLMVHYFAPVYPLALLFAARGLRAIGRWLAAPPPSSGWSSRGLAVGVVSLFVVSFAIEATVHVRRELAGGGRAAFTRGREAVLAKLAESPGRDLVFVHYVHVEEDGSPRYRHREWVYNAANIDAADVVWAREMSWEENSALAFHFADREMWRLHADEHPPRLEPLWPDAIAEPIRTDEVHRPTAWQRAGDE